MSQENVEVISAEPRHRRGKGEPLVLIHGGGGTWRQWQPVIPLLEPHHDVLAVNLVGHWGGAQAPPGVEASIDLFVDGVEADLDAAGWSTAHVAGTSLGGLIALVLAKRGRARTCTAMATIGGWEVGGDLGLRLVARSYGFFHWVTRLMARDPGRWSRRPRLRRLLYWHHFARPENMDPAYTAHMIVGVANCTILPDLIDWARHHAGPTGLDRISCPVQILFPAEDHVFPRRRYGAGLLGAVPNAEVREVPGAGHVATWDQPELVTDAILDFTSRHSD
jgi:pimeloyl-ACP methyl ester carboxylesterase